eukprot:3937380-Rhodomonas_salina.1
MSRSAVQRSVPDNGVDSSVGDSGVLYQKLRAGPGQGHSVGQYRASVSRRVGAYLRRVRARKGHTERELVAAYARSVPDPP